MITLSSLASSGFDPRLRADADGARPQREQEEVDRESRFDEGEERERGVVQVGPPKRSRTFLPTKGGPTLWLRR